MQYGSSFVIFYSNKQGFVYTKLSLKRFCLIMIFSISIMNFSILWWILVFNEF